ncbi:hypothetical protein [Pseudomonas sp. RL_5y_Pfl2_69]|uniref:hypothetical protein n=1 Tax=Pseudomonas sp. RL_5y_Pfl2_69 TaxID=3088711 RepID=UPI0030D9E1C8
MERTLAKAAEYLGTTRPKLIKLMREKGLLNERNLPAFPVRDREYLRVKDSNWFHAELGMQYSQSTRVRQPGTNAAGGVRTGHRSARKPYAITSATESCRASR